MGVRPIPVDKFVRWLESRGLRYVRTTKHDLYNYPDRDPRKLTRPISIRTKYKDIPLLHIHTNLSTLGISKAEFEKEIKNF